MTTITTMPNAIQIDLYIQNKKKAGLISCFIINQFDSRLYLKNF